MHWQMVARNGQRTGSTMSAERGQKSFLKLCDETEQIDDL